MNRIHISFEPEQLETLDRQAAKLGVSRTELIRSRAVGRIMDVGAFRSLCAEAKRRVGITLPSSHVEALVGFTLSRALGYEEEPNRSSPSSRPPAAE